MYVATNGNANYLLRKCAKIKRHKKPSKKYEIDVSDLKMAKEQNKKEEEDKMN